MTLRSAIGVLLLTTTVAPFAGAQDYDGGVTGWGPAPTLTSADGEFTMKIRGRLMIDYWHVDGSGETFGIPEDLDLPSGWDFRRARLGAEGTVLTDWNYRIEVDYNGDDVVMKDAFIAYDGFKNVDIQVGHHKEPFSLEELTSSRYITFMERAVPNLFVPSRSVGVGLSGGNDTFTMAGGVYGPTYNRADSKILDDRTSVTGRVTWSPVNTGTKLVHLGAAASYTDLNEEGRLFRLIGRPEVHEIGPRLLATSIQEANDTFRYGLEAAAVYGPLSFQAEYMADRVDYVDPDFGDPTFDGYYAFLSWFITGESRPYSGGKFGRVKPKADAGRGGKGAIEVAVRYSRADLRSSENEVTQILGGKEENFAAGINWYINGYVRMMLNYVHFDVVDSLERPFGFEDVDGDAIGARLQIHW